MPPQRHAELNLNRSISNALLCIDLVGSPCPKLTGKLCVNPEEVREYLVAGQARVNEEILELEASSCCWFRVEKCKIIRRGSSCNFNIQVCCSSYVPLIDVKKLKGRRLLLFRFALSASLCANSWHPRGFVHETFLLRYLCELQTTKFSFHFAFEMQLF